MLDLNEKRDYVLEMKEITKAFPGVLALDKVSIKVREATTHVLCGENGAGKSTLMKVLSGEHEIDGGEILFQGKKLDNKDAKSSLNAGISMIHQELSPILDMTIAENIYLDREPVHNASNFIGKHFVDYKTLYKQTQDLLDQLGLEFNAHQKMKELSVAGMQLIEITKAISRDSKLVIMDEPTSAITDKEVDILFKQIEDLKKKGVAIIYITHKMDEIFKIADDITVIRDGQFVAADYASNYDENKLVAQMVGREIKNVFPKLETEIGDPVLEVKNLTGEKFRDVSFTVKKGEILGLAGLVGAGRTEVVRAIFGLDPIYSGQMFLNGQEINIRNTEDAIKNGIAMVSEDRKEEGLVLKRNVLENISLGNLKRFAPGLFINASEEKKEALRMIEMLRVKVPHPYTPTSALSGGNQQKVVIAKWLLCELNILILDEPTRGIDVGSKSEIHKLMSEFTQKGLAVIMISSELPEIMGMSDRVVVMQEGDVKGELSRGEFTQESIMKLATGGKI